MAKRRKKARKHGRRRKGYVFTAARRRALKKAQRARKRRHGSKRKRRHGGRRKRRHSRKHSKRRRRSGGHVRHGGVYERIYAKMIARGRSPAQAAKVAARASRMRSGSARRYFEREAAQAKSKAQLSNLFAGFGAAGHLAHQAR